MNRYAASTRLRRTAGAVLFERAGPSGANRNAAAVGGRVAPEDVERFPTLPFTRYAARTTAEAVRLIERWRPRLVAIRLGAATSSTLALCAPRQDRSAPVGILAVMASPERAPAALKAGCHAILLKPFR
jgi:CheY-like chemotaxis protein